MNVSGYDALTFDIMGTLVDYRAGAMAWLQDRLAEAGANADREAVLASFLGAEARHLALNPQTPSTDTLPEVWADIAGAFAVPLRPDDGPAFIRSIARWPAFEDSVDALRDLRERHTLVAITNADRAAADWMSATLDHPFHIVVTAADAGAVKPDTRPFEVALARVAELGIPKNRVLHVAQGLLSDLVPARKLGLPMAWINRYADTPGIHAPDIAVRSMGEFLDALR